MMDNKACPSCRQLVEDAKAVCPYCSSDMNGQERKDLLQMKKRKDV